MENERNCDYNSLVDMDIDKVRREKMRANFLKERDYAHGYQKALQDVYEFFQKRSNAMKVLHLYNQSGIELILKGMVDNAEEMQKLGSDIEFEIHEEAIGKKKQFTRIEVAKIKR